MVNSQGQGGPGSGDSAEDEAGLWLTHKASVSRETLDRIGNFIHFLKEENQRQNLVSATSLSDVWGRHIVDSAQLSALAPRAPSWLDLGSGAGFPGLIIAALRPATHVTLIEARPRRVDFLRNAAEILRLPPHTRILAEKVERLATESFDVISARAFAPLDRLFAVAHRFSKPDTHWILPKGQSAHTELERVRASWQGEFRVEPSITDPAAGIIVATAVLPRTDGMKAR